jgi:hypothetical protein
MLALDVLTVALPYITQQTLSNPRIQPVFHILYLMSFVLLLAYDLPSLLTLLGLLGYKFTSLAGWDRVGCKTLIETDRTVWGIGVDGTA